MDDPSTSKDSLVIICPDPENPAIRKSVELKILPHGSGCDGWKYTPLMKRLVGIPGDKITVYDYGVLINEIKIDNSRIKFKIMEKLIHPGYSHVLGPDEYWVMSSYNPNSFDSRYFGTINGSQIKMYAKPIFTIE